MTRVRPRVLAVLLLAVAVAAASFVLALPEVPPGPEPGPPEPASLGAVPLATQPADPLRMKAAADFVAEIRKMRLGSVTRNAILSPRDGPVRLVAEPREGSVLSFGYGVDGGAAGSCALEVAAVRDDGRVETVFSEDAVSGALRRWRDVDVSLDRFAGETVELRFARKGPSCRLLWSFPRVHAPSRSGINVILVSIDTLRADRLNSYGYSARDTSPNTDRLAGQGVRCATAVANAPWTTPSHFSMLTGLYPSSHGVMYSPDDAATGRVPPQVLRADVRTLAQRLYDRGYATAAFTGSLSLAGAYGFSRGFDAYDESLYSIHPAATNEVWRWLQRHADERFFLFLHTYEVHAPYTRGELLAAAERAQLQTVLDDMNARVRGAVIGGVHPIETTRMRTELTELGLYNAEVTGALYDGGIRHVDRFIGELIEELERLELSRRTLVVLTSDHGDELGEHAGGFYNAHGHTLYEELVHVPLIWYLPGRLEAGRVVKMPVQSVDIVPTVMELVGIEDRTEVDGRSLVAIMRDPGREQDRAVFSEATTVEEIKMIRTAAYKYTFAIPHSERAARDWSRSFVPRRRLREQLFDLDEDPSERDNIVSVATARAEKLREALDRFVERGAAPRSDAPGLQEEHEAALRALGYIR